MFSRALILEDEKNLSQALLLALEEMEISASSFETIEEAKAFLNEESSWPELMVLDRELPDGEGLVLCRELRDQGYEGAILCLTAAGEVEDRIQGLEAGADDYLPKPFSWDELAARVKALSRRFQSSESASTWYLDKSKLRIKGPKGWVKVTPLEFKLIARLVEKEGEILTREDLLRDVWGYSILTKTRTVDYFMVRLRRMFEESPENPNHFLTIRGAGYQFKR